MTAHSSQSNLKSLDDMALALTEPETKQVGISQTLPTDHRHDVICDVKDARERIADALMHLTDAMNSALYIRDNAELLRRLQITRNQLDMADLMLGAAQERMP